MDKVLTIKDLLSSGIKNPEDSKTLSSIDDSLSGILHLLQEPEQTKFGKFFTLTREKKKETSTATEDVDKESTAKTDKKPAEGSLVDTFLKLTSLLKKDKEEIKNESKKEDKTDTKKPSDSSLVDYFIKLKESFKKDKEEIKNESKKEDKKDAENSLVNQFIKLKTLLKKDKEENKT